LQADMFTAAKARYEACKEQVHAMALHAVLWACVGGKDKHTQAPDFVRSTVDGWYSVRDWAQCLGSKRKTL
jgi:hypothetical protein